MPVYQIDGLTPVVPEESYVHPTAVLIGFWPDRGERRREHPG